MHLFLNPLKVSKIKNKDWGIKLSNQMEEIKRLNDKLYEYEVVNQQQAKEISMLKETNNSYKDEKQELEEQIKTFNTELTEGEKNKQGLLMLTKAMDKINKEKLELADRFEAASNDIENLKNHCKGQNDYIIKIKNELEKLLVNFKSKTNEWNEWKSKYMEADEQIGKMEQTIEDLQKETYHKTKQMESIKNKEIKELEESLRKQFESEINQYEEKNRKIQNEISSVRHHNKEVANEVLRITNENSQMNLTITKMESERNKLNAEIEKLKKSNNEMKAEFESSLKAQQELVPRIDLIKSQENENRFKDIIRNLKSEYERQLQEERKAKTDSIDMLKNYQSRQKFSYGKERCKLYIEDFEQLKLLLAKKEEEMKSYIEENENMKKQYFNARSKYNQMQKERDECHDGITRANENAKKAKEKYDNIKLKLEVLNEQWNGYILINKTP